MGFSLGYKSNGIRPRSGPCSITVCARSALKKCEECCLVLSPPGWRPLMENQRRPRHLSGSHFARSNRCRTGTAQIIVEFSVRQNQQQLFAHRLSSFALWTIEGGGSKCFELIH